ncbi:WD40 repeat domain-containing protein [Ktedonobacter racemifer]|uniref:WD40 repeat, subgroup n=1 Tax=Ktedonobacter racemifer DSM 44963 TaxID=485913 RepID=D6U443_KTERA|nr:PD40 domain-containing protein [Ktedonobacter racemifer]EFH83063.1 hypothetical protein Krac_3977 [Ktedonobacter racemifer DSM 44963]
MKKNHDNQFHPESVDTDIDKLLQIQTQAKITEQKHVPLIRAIHEQYMDDPEVLDRAWKRVTQQIKGTEQQTVAEMPIPIQDYQIAKGNRHMQDQVISRNDDKGKTILKRLSGIGLGLVAALILASVVIVLNAYQQSHPTSVTGSQAAPSPSVSTAPTHGHVVYSAQQEYGSSSVSWSSDGQRVAAVRNGTNAIGGGTVEIWDALTGLHRVNLELNPNEVLSIPQAWSPKSELLAVATSERVLIVNGQNGKIVTSYRANSIASTPTGTVSAVSASTALTSVELPATKMSTLSYRLPLSSAPSFRSIAWSADGKSIASVYSSGAGADGPAVIQIWNPFTGKSSTSLTTEPGWSISDISWSPDGAEIAASMSNSGNLPQSQVQVWNVQTRQVVFQQSMNQYVIGSIWQPGSHNLAFSLLPDGSYNAAVLQIWNVQTKQRIKTFAGIAANTMAWSSDGKEIAYDNRVGGGHTAGVTILDSNTGQKVYTYSVSAKANQSVNISVPAWSPDGKYIVTSESTVSNTPSKSPSGLPTQPSSVVKVWIA